MKRFSIISCLALILVLWAGKGIYGQQTTPETMASSGQTDSSSTGMISWTMGEALTQTFSGGSEILSQGFQQPNLIVTALPEPMTDWEIKAFPIPASDFLNVSYEKYPGDLRLELIDLHGRSLSVGQTKEEPDRTRLDLSRISAGQYFLRALNAETGSPLKVFKVQVLHP